MQHLLKRSHFIISNYQPAITRQHTSFSCSIYLSDRALPCVFIYERSPVNILSFFYSIY
ncbi:hypothetical protein [Nostoc sp. FACHB-110]|uniref:hypothetical protein n=1 Tax=Nostoc sp. FACHB-110 TaxID=2692834 RepID=UPI00168A1DB5|nr:hypothetical protein [Nostoc sp. FACHB-110]MBD2441149.1 hypothetical protein [Nostoc sp. FACHB-110]